MRTKFIMILAIVLASCNRSQKPAPTSKTAPSAMPSSTPAASAVRPASTGRTLTEERRGFVTKAVDKGPHESPPPKPPAKIFSLERYRSPVGDLWTYVTPRPSDGARRPAIVWISGGFDNSIGDAWTRQSADNDQSASAFREAGIVLVLPSLRGANGNPGHREVLFGEVDDVLAALDYAAKLPYVDPARVYLGGHSTGGTLALLVAESTDRVRAVFAFGPVANILTYGDSLTFDRNNVEEARLRSPMHFTSTIRVPTFAIEGAKPVSNAPSLPFLVRGAGTAPLKTYAVAGVDHFSILAPVTRLIASKINGDTGPTTNITLSEAELVAATKTTTPAR
jgi:acetyl esterase/lipase